jgi:hypothetical protein
MALVPLLEARCTKSRAATRAVISRQSVVPVDAAQWGGPRPWTKDLKGWVRFGRVFVPDPGLGGCEVFFSDGHQRKGSFNSAGFGKRHGRYAERDRQRPVQRAGSSTTTSSGRHCDPETADTGRFLDRLFFSAFASALYASKRMHTLAGVKCPIHINTNTSLLVEHVRNLVEPPATCRGSHFAAKAREGKHTYMNQLKFIVVIGLYPILGGCSSGVPEQAPLEQTAVSRSAISIPSMSGSVA